jgi:hypothetical protein
LLLVIVCQTARSGKCSTEEGRIVELTAWNLNVWLPAMLLLGLVILGALLAFVAACDRV